MSKQSKIYGTQVNKMRSIVMLLSVAVLISCCFYVLAAGESEQIVWQRDEKKTFCTRCAKSLVPVSRRKATGKPGDCWPCDCNYSLSAGSSIEDFVPFVKRKHAGFGQIGKSDRKILRGRKVAVDICPPLLL